MKGTEAETERRILHNLDFDIPCTVRVWHVYNSGFRRGKRIGQKSADCRHSAEWVVTCRDCHTEMQACEMHRQVMVDNPDVECSQCGFRGKGSAIYDVRRLPGARHA